MNQNELTPLYQKEQKSIMMTCIMVFIFLQGWAFYFLFSLPEGLWICLGVVLFLALFFNKLTVRVSNESIYLAFGIGLIHRRISLESIAKVDAVRNKWWYGYGIRYTPHGWLWNIQGLEAIEITYTNGKCFRIGTDDPENLLKVLQKKRSCHLE